MKSLDKLTEIQRDLEALARGKRVRPTPRTKILRERRADLLQVKERMRLLTAALARQR